MNGWACCTACPAGSISEEEGATAAQVVAAFFAAERLFGLDALWQAIEQEAMPEPARLRLFSEAAVATRAHMADLLRAGGGTLTPSVLVADLLPGVSSLAEAADALLAGDTLALAARREADLTAIGAPAPLAAQVARLYALDGSVGLARLAREGGAEPVALTRAFIDLGFRLGLDWAQGTAARLDPADPWERLLVAGLARDFQQMRLDFLRLHLGGRQEDPLAGVAAWATQPERTVIEEAPDLLVPFEPLAPNQQDPNAPTTKPRPDGNFNPFVSPADFNGDGDVVLELCVSASGAVADAKVARSSGNHKLDDASVSQIRNARFEPATRSVCAQALEMPPSMQYRWPTRVGPMVPGSDELAPAARASEMPLRRATFWPTTRRSPV